MKVRSPALAVSRFVGARQRRLHAAADHVLEKAHIGPGAESAPGAGHDDDAHLVIGGGLFHGLPDLRFHRAGPRVELVRTVQRDRGDASGDRVLDLLIRHVTSIVNPSNRPVRYILCSVMTLFRFARAFVLIGGLAAYAQDASMALRTSVTYRTQRNSLQLTDEQRQQADTLAREAEQAGAAGQFGDAMRAYYHGMAVMRNVAWTPSYEFAAALQGKLDHAVVDPEKQVTVTLTPLYGSAGGQAEVGCVSGPGAKERTRRRSGSDRPRQSTPRRFRSPRRSRCRPIRPAITFWRCDCRPKAISPSPPRAPGWSRRSRCTSSRSPRRRRSSASGWPRPATGTARDGERRIPARALRAGGPRRGQSRRNYKFAEEFAKANEILDALDAGRDPFAGKHGDFRKAYRSAVDNTLQPYRILIPEVYNASKPSPVVVALHGMGGDENSMFDAYNGELEAAGGASRLHRGLSEGPRHSVDVPGVGRAGCDGRAGGSAARL